MPAEAADIVHVSDVVEAAVTVHTPDVPMITLFEIAVVLKPVPVIVNVVPLCATFVTVGVWVDDH